MEKLTSEEGVHWRGIMEALKQHLPDKLDDRDDFAYHLVREALNDIFGPDKWETYKNYRGTTYARKLRQDADCE